MEEEESVAAEEEKKKKALDCLCIGVPLLVRSSRKGELVPSEMLPAGFHCGEVWMNSAPVLVIVMLAS